MPWLICRDFRKLLRCLAKGWSWTLGMKAYWPWRRRLSTNLSARESCLRTILSKRIFKALLSGWMTGELWLTSARLGTILRTLEGLSHLKKLKLGKLLFLFLTNSWSLQRRAHFQSPWRIWSLSASNQPSCPSFCMCFKSLKMNLVASIHTSVACPNLLKNTRSCSKMRS
jgi:hypothetical protein